ncbi:MAG: hypothetical protein IPG48_09440 [Saprospiraceae bacterium]|nr:hypothetical protein [Saprospiraceae bacterium]
MSIASDIENSQRPHIAAGKFRNRRYFADDYKFRLGDIFAALLPAGSIWCTQKKTVQIIKTTK